MKLASVSKVTFIAGVILAASACSRDHIEAINLANEGDQAIKVNTEGAIQKYGGSTRSDRPCQSSRQSRIAFRLDVP